MLPDTFSEHPDPPTSLLCFILFKGCLLSRGSNVNCLCFVFRSFFSPSPHLPYRARSPLHSFPAAPLFCRHLSIQNTILPQKVQWSCSALSVTKLQLSGTTFLFVSAILLLLVLSNLFEPAFSLKNVFFSPIPLR